MGKSEDTTSIKPEKGSPPRQELTNIQLYPDWTTIQAYYGPGVPLPPPYFNSAVTAGHFPHPHVWASQQPLMPPYGLPYSTIYSQGVVYAQPAVPLVATPLSSGSTKKLKRLDGLTVPVGNDGAEVDAEGSAHDPSQSVGIDASSDGSDGKTGAYDSVSGIPLAPENIAGYSMESPNGKVETSAAFTAAGFPVEVSVRDDRQLKRERRKQANRESARRSRLRKQAEIEELMERYESLKMENLTLKSEITQLTEDSEKVRLENAALMEKLNNAQPGLPGKVGPDQTNSNLTLPNSTN